MPTLNMSAAAAAGELKPRGRRSIRRPQHTHQLRYRPFEIVPFMIAPVLPGESLRNLQLQARIVSNPLDSFLLGAWAEHYYFYVKLRDLTTYKSGIETMLLDPSSAWTAMDTTTARTIFYTAGTSAVPNYLEEAYKQIVKFYFRTPEEVADSTWDDYTSNNLHLASIKGKTWLDSAITDTNYIANQVPDQTLTVGGDGSFTMKEVEDLMMMWKWEQAHGYIGGKALTFEEWLKAQGINVPGAQDDTEEGKPELIRFALNWTYPVNTVNPSDGEPSTAWSWSIRERADKDRFFTEPGMLVGITVVRPKVYLSKQDTYAMAAMDKAQDWLPSLLSQDPSFTMKKFAAAAAPLQNQAAAFWVDLKDLFLYGDQFVNFALTETNAGLVALPTSAMQKRYVATTDIDNLFVTKTAGTGKVYQDGVTSLMVASHIGRDTSATIAKG